MAAALFRRGTGLCVRCIHRELCRLVWRPQSALFSSKPSDRKQPRRTHIKKPKPQPAVDVAKLLEQLFSQCRPDTAPPAGKARPAKASSMPTKPPTSNVPPLSKTELAVSVFPAASSFNQVDSVPKKTTSTFNTSPSPQPKSVSPTNPKTSYSSETPQQSPLDFIQAFAADSVSNVTVPPTSTTPASLGSEAAAIEWQTSAETIETKVETATEPVELKTATVLPLSAHMEEKNVETSSLSAATVEPLIKTTTESQVEPSLSPVETLDVRAAVVEGPVEPTVDAPAEEVQTKGTDSGVVDVSQTTKEEPLNKTTVESPVEASHFPVETLETRAAVVGGPVEPTIDVTVDIAAETKSTNSGVVNISHTTTVEHLLETTVEPPVEASTSPVETLESRAAEPSVDATVDAPAQAVQTNSTDSGPVSLSHIAEEEPLIEITLEPSVEASTSPLETLENRDAVAEGSVETTIETEADTAAQAVQTNSTDSGVVNVSYSAKEEPLIETTIEPAVEASTSPLESRSAVSEGTIEPTIENEAADNLKELLCHVPAVLSKTPGSDPPVGAHGDSLQMEEKVTEAEAMTLESITLAKVKAEVGGLQTEVLLETRNALEKEAEVQAKEEKMEVKTTIEDVAVFEDTTEAEILTLDSISEATDAIEAETSVILEAMFGSEQGPRQPPDTLLVDQKLGQQDEAEKEFGEQEGSVLEAMTLESVTLAEVEASLGTLENESLSETSDYLEKEAEILAGEKRMEVADEVASEETTEALKIESLSLPEALQTDALMEELLFSVPGHVTEGPIGQEAVRVNILDATVDVDTAAAVTDDFPASPALKEVLLGQEVEEETEALGNEGTHTDLDPVQRLFLEKIREYNNMRRLNGGPLEAEPDYEKYLSEETAKLQRLYGGGDLSSFPQFTFTEPKMDQDSK